MKVNSHTDNLKFNKSWRSYQQRILDLMDKHLSDGRLHVVAAPGAGKTILGLEAFRRLGKPALALSPTRNIRDQWILRLKDFVSTDSEWPVPWTSSNLKSPGFFTSITYQSFHAICRNKEEDDNIIDDKDDTGEEPDNGAPTGNEITEIVDLLKKAKIGTIILDEAHHLRSEWWKALTKIIGEMEGVTLISLTATPPYDAIGSEWDKYIKLCGPIDEEISVPELVKDGTLCPHQDYIWIVTPPEKDRDLLIQYDGSVEKLCTDLASDEQFQNNIKSHPWLASPEISPEEILDDPELAVAFLVYLNATGEEPPERLLTILDTDKKDLPGMSRRWWQVLVKAYLFGDKWPETTDIEDHRDQLARRLRAESLLWRRDLRLYESGPVKKKLSLSSTKIEGCLAIYRHESAFRGDGLRQVVLTDFIRDNEKTYTQSGCPESLGAFPVFMKLAQNTYESEKKFIALLTGRVSILHNSLMQDLKILVGEDNLIVNTLEEIPGFSRLSLKTGHLTNAFTLLLKDGKIRVLVGTRSLLGEGWDAPVVNSLVLCSFVGSSMLTNQMRGRAIRSDRSCPDKYSSIWHLIAVTPDTEAGLSDVYDLERRFSTFAGLSKEEAVIESGLDRMGLVFYHRGTVTPLTIDPHGNNRHSVEQLHASSSLSEKWAAAIDMGTEVRINPGVNVAKPPRARPLHFIGTLRYLLYQALFIFIYNFLHFLGNIRNIHEMKSFIQLLGIAVIAGFLYTTPKLVKALIILIRHLPVDGAIRQIAFALRDALCESGIFDNSRVKIAVNTTEDRDGSCYVSLNGASFYQKTLFADCLKEMLGPIENPRYLITRHSMSRRTGRIDYHAVPYLLSTKKELAILFHKKWLKRVGDGELIYTRSTEGRRTLLQARTKAFSSAMNNNVRRLDRWQ